MSFEESKNTNVIDNPAELYEALFEYNPCQTIVVDNTGKIIKYNKAQSEKAERLPNPGDIIFKDYAGSGEIDMYAELISCIENGQQKEFPNLSYADNIFTTRISPFPGGAIIITEDVTDEEHNKEALRSSEQFNQAFFDYNPCQTIVVDNDGKIIKYNLAQKQKAARLPNPGDIIFKDYAAGYEHDMYTELMDCIKCEQTKDFPDQVYADNIFAITISPFPGGATIITEDVTKRKRAEQNLEKAHENLKKQDVKKTSFVMNLAHEMRTSLCILNNALSLIDSGAAGKVDKKLKELFAISDRSIKRLAYIVDDFVELSEIEEGKFTLAKDRVDFKKLIGETVDRHKDIIKERKIKIKCHQPKTDVIATADGIKLNKVFDHILENAARFVGKKGKIDITVEDRGSDVSVSIEDNGNGIASDKMLEIFESFVKFDVPGSTNQGGMGLGLTLAKGIVDLHNGQIHVSSSLGKGSSFQVVIPK